MLTYGLRVVWAGVAREQGLVKRREKCRSGAADLGGH